MNDVIATNTVDLNAQSVPRENNYSLSLSLSLSLSMSLLAILNETGKLLIV